MINHSIAHGHRDDRGAGAWAGSALIFKYGDVSRETDGVVTREHTFVACGAVHCQLPFAEYDGKKPTAEFRSMPTPDELYAEASKLKNAGKLPEAVAALEEILKVAPDHVLTHSALAVHLQKLGRNDEAVAHARRVTELEPNDHFSFTQLSVICQRCGRIQEAEDAMARAHALQGRPH
jgi:tetratricopeptide (TPR) repeat protein